MFSPSTSSAAVDYCVSQIASNDIKLAITALKELEGHFKAKGPAVWLKHLNQVCNVNASSYSISVVL